MVDQTMAEFRAEEERSRTLLTNDVVEINMAMVCA